MENLVQATSSTNQFRYESLDTVPTSVDEKIVRRKELQKIFGVDTFTSQKSYLDLKRYSKDTNAIPQNAQKIDESLQSTKGINARAIEDFNIAWALQDWELAQKILMSAVSVDEDQLLVNAILKKLPIRSDEPIDKPRDEGLSLNEKMIEQTLQEYVRSKGDGDFAIKTYLIELSQLSDPETTQQTSQERKITQRKKILIAYALLGFITVQSIFNGFNTTSQYHQNVEAGKSIANNGQQGIKTTEQIIVTAPKIARNVAIIGEHAIKPLPLPEENTKQLESESPDHIMSNVGREAFNAGLKTKIWETKNLQPQFGEISYLETDIASKVEYVQGKGMMFIRETNSKPQLVTTNFSQGPDGLAHIYSSSVIEWYEFQNANPNFIGNRIYLPIALGTSVSSIGVENIENGVIKPVRWKLFRDTKGLYFIQFDKNEELHGLSVDYKIAPHSQLYPSNFHDDTTGTTFPQIDNINNANTPQIFRKSLEAIMSSNLDPDQKAEAIREYVIHYGEYSLDKSHDKLRNNAKDASEWFQKWLEDPSSACEPSNAIGGLILQSFGFKVRFVDGYVINDENIYASEGHGYIQVLDRNNEWKTLDFTQLKLDLDSLDVLSRMSPPRPHSPSQSNNQFFNSDGTFKPDSASESHFPSSPPDKQKGSSNSGSQSTTPLDSQMGSSAESGSQSTALPGKQKGSSKPDSQSNNPKFEPKDPWEFLAYEYLQNYNFVQDVEALMLIAAVIAYEFSKFKSLKNIDIRSLESKEKLQKLVQEFPQISQIEELAENLPKALKSDAPFVKQVFSSLRMGLITHYRELWAREKHRAKLLYEPSSVAKTIEAATTQEDKLKLFAKYLGVKVNTIPDMLLEARLKNVRSDIQWSYLIRSLRDIHLQVDNKRVHKIFNKAVKQSSTIESKKGYINSVLNKVGHQLYKNYVRQYRLKTLKNLLPQNEKKSANTKRKMDSYEQFAQRLIKQGVSERMAGMAQIPYEYNQLKKL